MDRKSVLTFIAIYCLVAGIGFLSSKNSAKATAAPVDAAYIVQAESASAAAHAVRSVGGHVRQHLVAIAAVRATLADDEVAVLRANGERFTVFENRGVSGSENSSF